MASPTPFGPALPPPPSSVDFQPTNRQALSAAFDADRVANVAETRVEERQGPGFLGGLFRDPRGLAERNVDALQTTFTGGPSRFAIQPQQDRIGVYSDAGTTAGVALGIAAPLAAGTGTVFRTGAQLGLREAGRQTIRQGLPAARNFANEAALETGIDVLASALPFSEGGTRVTPGEIFQSVQTGPVEVGLERSLNRGIGVGRSTLRTQVLTSGAAGAGSELIVANSPVSEGGTNVTVSELIGAGTAGVTGAGSPIAIRTGGNVINRFARPDSFGVRAPSGGTPPTGTPAGGTATSTGATTVGQPIPGTQGNTFTGPIPRQPFRARGTPQSSTQVVSGTGRIINPTVGTPTVGTPTAGTPTVTTPTVRTPIATTPATVGVPRPVAGATSFITTSRGLGVGDSRRVFSTRPTSLGLPPAPTARIALPPAPTGTVALSASPTADLALSASPTADLALSASPRPTLRCLRRPRRTPTLALWRGLGAS